MLAGKICILSQSGWKESRSAVGVPVTSSTAVMFWPAAPQSEVRLSRAEQRLASWERDRTAAGPSTTTSHHCTVQLITATGTGRPAPPQVISCGVQIPVPQFVLCPTRSPANHLTSIICERRFLYRKKDTKSFWPTSSTFVKKFGGCCCIFVFERKERLGFSWDVHFGHCFTMYTSELFSACYYINLTLQSNPDLLI